MCGRYTLKSTPEALAEQFELPEVPWFEPRYNIAPSQPVLAVRSAPETAGRALVRLRWGLIPSWADDAAIGNKMINARAETVAERPAFRTAFRRRRCLVLADGFYEWAKLGVKQPYHIRMSDGSAFAIAGLWERWERGDEPVESCTLLTTEANEVVARIHNRMPVIVQRADYSLWIDPSVQQAELLNPLLRPFPSEAMTASPVGRWVNNPAHDDPRCLEALPAV